MWHFLPSKQITNLSTIWKLRRMCQCHEGGVPVWRFWVGVDGGRSPLGFVEGVRTLVLFTHPVHHEHHAEDGAKQSHNGTHDHRWNKRNKKYMKKNQFTSISRGGKRGSTALFGLMKTIEFFQQTRKNWRLRRHFCSLRLPINQDLNPYIPLLQNYP